jgi:hypothetical protein
LFGNDSSEKFASGIKEGDRAIGFRDRVVWFTRLSKDNCCKCLPGGVISIVREDGIKEVN